MYLSQFFKIRINIIGLGLLFYYLLISSYSFSYENNWSIKTQSSIDFQKEVSDTNTYLFDLPHCSEETERLLKYRQVARNLVGMNLKLESKDLFTVYDFLTYLEEKIDNKRITIDINEDHSFLLKDFRAIDNLSKKEVKNLNFIRDGHGQKILRVQIKTK